MFKNLKIITLFLLLIFPKSFAIENKIILKINNEIITSLDILDEIKYLGFFNKNIAELKNDEVNQIALQSIIRFKNKKNEIDKNFKNQNFDREYLDLSIENTYKNLGFKNLEDFKKALLGKNISYTDFENKIKTNFLWNQLIYLKYKDSIVINENELKDELKNNKNIKKSFYLNEIVYQVENLNEITNLYNQIQEDISKIGFKNSVIKYSISKSAENGGSLGWIDEKMINKEILNQLNAIPVNSITKPIRISGGVLVLQKADEKEEKIEININDELTKLIRFKTEQQLSNYSNLYYNKITKDLKIETQ